MNNEIQPMLVQRTYLRCLALLGTVYAWVHRMKIHTIASVHDWFYSNERTSSDGSPMDGGILRSQRRTTMENSAIEWTHHTSNPWKVALKVGEGCRNSGLRGPINTDYEVVELGR